MAKIPVEQAKISVRFISNICRAGAHASKNTLRKPVGGYLLVPDKK
jgi:hypothetical protein